LTVSQESVHINFNHKMYESKKNGTLIITIMPVIMTMMMMMTTVI